MGLAAAATGTAKLGIAIIKSSICSFSLFHTFSELSVFKSHSIDETQVTGKI